MDCCTGLDPVQRERDELKAQLAAARRLLGWVSYRSNKDPDNFSHLPLSSADSTNVARNSGYCEAWNGPYAPSDRATRALVLMNRIESHASARRWCRTSGGIQRNMELLG